MAYDEGLAERIRETLGDAPDVTEKKMFGGLAFLAEGKMFVGITGDDLMVRVGPEQYESSLAKPHVREMDFTGRAMKGYVYVAPDGVEDDQKLAQWVALAKEFASSL